MIYCGVVEYVWNMNVCAFFLVFTDVGSDMVALAKLMRQMVNLDPDAQEVDWTLRPATSAFTDKLKRVLAALHAKDDPATVADL